MLSNSADILYEGRCKSPKEAGDIAERDAGKKEGFRGLFFCGLTFQHPHLGTILYRFISGVLRLVEGGMGRVVGILGT